MKKIIFLDIDGTLLDHTKTHTILQSTINAIQQARNNGHYIILCTGRTKSNVHPTLIPFETDAQIYGAGTTIIINNQTHFNKSIPQDDLNKMIIDFNKYKFGYTLEGEFESFCDEYCIERRKHMAEKHGISQELEDIISSEDTHFPMSDYNPESSIMNKITVWSDQDDYLNEFVAKWQDQYDCIVHERKKGETHRTCEILLKNISKASGMDIVLDYFHMDLKDSLAYGDSMNDYDMIQHAGIGICMGNGVQKLKDIADDICGPSHEDSIYESFKKYHLI